MTDAMQEEPWVECIEHWTLLDNGAYLCRLLVADHEASPEHPRVPFGDRIMAVVREGVVDTMSFVIYRAPEHP